MTAGVAGWSASALLEEVAAGMLRSRLGDAEAVWLGTVAGVSCCACSVVPKRQRARESESRCGDEKKWCMGPLGVSSSLLR